MGPKAKPAIPILIESLKTNFWRKSSAIDALGEIGSKDIIPILLDFFKNKANKDFKTKAAIVLAKTVSHNSSDFKLIQELLNDTNEDLRISVAKALGSWKKKNLAVLIRSLKSKIRKERYAAAYLISHIDKPSPSILLNLLQALKDPDTEIKRFLIYSLENLRAVSAVSELTKLLEDNDEMVQVAALSALEKIGNIGPKMVPFFIQALKSKSSIIKNTALLYLRRMGKHSTPALKELIVTLKEDQNWYVRHRTICAIGAIGSKASPAIPALVKALDDKNYSVRKVAILIGLSSIGTKAIPALIRILKTGNNKKRAWAAYALLFMGNKAVSAVPALIEALKDKNYSVRISSLKALKAIGPLAKDAISYIIPLLADEKLHGNPITALKSIGKDAVLPLIRSLENKKLQYFAVKALGELGPQAKPAIAALTKILDNKKPKIRNQVIKTLGKIGINSSQFPILIQMLKDKDDNVKVAAIKILANLGTRAISSLPMLIEIQKNTPKLREEVISALGNFGPKATLAIPILIERLKDKDVCIRREAAASLAKIDSQMTPISIAVLDYILKYEQSCSALESLASIGPKSLPTLVKHLEHTSCVVSVLGYIGPAAIPILAQMLKNKEPHDSYMGCAIVKALAQIGPKAVPVLTKALKDHKPSVRKMAANKLAKIGPKAYNSVSTLRILLNIREDMEVKNAAIKALGEIGPTAKSATMDLKKLLEDFRFQKLALESIKKIASKKN